LLIFVKIQNISRTVSNFTGRILNNKKHSYCCKEGMEKKEKLGKERKCENSRVEFEGRK